MSLLTRLTPINLLEEKEKFFADQTYNPQFVYDQPVGEETLNKYDQPQDSYSALAKHILQKTYHHRNEDDLVMLEGRELTQSEVARTVEAFLKMHHLETRYELLWSSSFIARTTITTDQIKLRLPVSFRREGLLSMLYHEIGTHALRRVNYEKQPWHKKKKRYEFGEYLKTEEGLASLHGLVPKTFKSAYVSALRYYAAELSQRGSFAEVWHNLARYTPDLERRWVIVFRQKRGLSDTSQPGGYTKDMVYFEGLVDVWRWLKEHNFDPTDLYYGKMALEDVEKARELNPGFKPQMPSFFILDPEKYAQNLEEIGQWNELA
jgi:hypothetical protein